MQSCTFLPKCFCPLECLRVQTTFKRRLCALEINTQRREIQGWELCLRLSLCKPLRALQSSSTPAPQNFSSSPPPPPPLQDTPPVISCVNHTGCLKTWSRIFPTVVSSFLYEYPLGYIALYTSLTNIL